MIMIIGVQRPELRTLVNYFGPDSNIIADRNEGQNNGKKTQAVLNSNYLLKQEES